MSAWIVDRKHIDLLVSYACRGYHGQYAGDARAARWVAEDPAEAAWPQWTYRDARHAVDVDGETVSGPDYLGRILWTENVRSIHYRYPDTLDGGSYPGPLDFSAGEALAYRHTDHAYMLTPREAIHACDCLDYQSCEHPEWRSSEAYRALQAIRELAIAALVTEGDSGPWGWDDEALAQRRAVA
jgi:hypothetical protein